MNCPINSSDVKITLASLQGIPALNSYDPGTCDDKKHGHEVLVKDRDDEEIILICVKNRGVYQWRPMDGRSKKIAEHFYVRRLLFPESIRF